MYTNFQEPLTGTETHDKTWYSAKEGRLRIRSAVTALVGLAVIASVAGLPVVWSARSTSIADLEGMEQTLFKSWKPPEARKRCQWVQDMTIAKQDPNASPEDLTEQYTTQSKDANTFYRATAHLFWQDFVHEGWGLYDLRTLGLDTMLSDGSPIERTSTWTWVTGDQHLSNFGAWHNRKKQVVFGVNDFDEAAIFDFRLDVWRVAVSIYNHALSNGLGDAKAEAAVLTFTEVYLATVEGYIGNELAATFEVRRASP